MRRHTGAEPDMPYKQKNHHLFEPLSLQGVSLASFAGNKNIIIFLLIGSESLNRANLC